MELGVNMVNDFITSVVISAITSFIVASVTIYFTIKSENKRWYANYLLEKRTNALYELFESLIDSKIIIYTYAKCPPTKYAEWRATVEKDLNNYNKARAVASIYLSEEEMGIFNDVNSIFKIMGRAILHSLPEEEKNLSDYLEDFEMPIRESDWKRLKKSTKEAEELLEKKLNSEFINEFNKPIICGILSIMR